MKRILSITLVMIILVTAFMYFRFGPNGTLPSIEDINNEN